jgi:hypothetical protein
MVLAFIVDSFAGGFPTSEELQKISGAEVSEILIPQG